MSTYELPELIDLDYMLSDKPTKWQTKIKVHFSESTNKSYPIPIRRSQKLSDEHASRLLFYSRLSTPTTDTKRLRRNSIGAAAAKQSQSVSQFEQELNAALTKNEELYVLELESALANIGSLKNKNTQK